MKSNLRKAVDLVRFLRGFTVRIGLPLSFSLWIAKKIYPPEKITGVQVEHGWVKEMEGK